MSNTIRINTTPNGSDKYLKVKLEQDWDYIEILSLKISQEETYQKFCSDYGAIVGRVQISGVGVPNAKVSFFIPLDDTDKNNPLIKGIYPYETITDKNSDGIRYNLLPKDGDTTNICATPIGTFPNKREVLDNETILQVYCKYYKFTTTTNHAGDFMLFGVPLGTHVVHIDADVSDIGILSQRPYDLISQGTPKKYFSSSTKFNSDKNLDKLVQVKSMNSGVNVQPFWGDTENCEIGINRLDFELNYTIIPSAIFMGSIYGDQDKNSINKRCVPRKKLGVLCEQIAGTGTIDMIRQTIDGSIEEFSVDGGQLIDEDGTWAYQIPMNLDYVVTSEYGTLIPSKDSNTGIATRARVRFKIGMDETGGEGRIRTRAKYLVPNNPNNQNDVDYTFGSDTKDSSFKDLHWNKIYTVSNYISRFQRNTHVGYNNGIVNFNPSQTRSMTAIKDVDACGGDKTPFPYNRLSSDVNPLFGIICIVMRILSMLIYMLNILIIPLINDIIFILNLVLNGIVSMINLIIDGLNSVANLLGLNFNRMDPINIPYIPCISISCPSNDGSKFAPGCVKGAGIDGGLGWDQANSNGGVDYYFNDGIDSHAVPFSSAGLTQCISLEMAKTLNMFQFDFYNDWVNGSLFGFLLKYKKKKSGREKFCEYDCDDFPNQDGLNNNCHNNVLLDTCFAKLIDVECQLQFTESSTIREGLVKKVGNDLYYAATTHDTNFKLFATDIISLGSVFSCDWQGIPKINDLLIPTTYKLPPDIDELDDYGNVETCGMISLDTIQNPFTGGSPRGLFFFINCDGIHINKRQCLNLRHICEIGVDIDEIQENGITYPSDCIIGSNDIDENNGKFFRNTFTSLNIGTTNTITSTNFNTGNAPRYDFTSANDNDQDYIDFRGYNSADQSFGQTKHSYFFYFGLLPGKTALDKMNEKFFTTCEKIIKDDILIKASTTPALIGDNGSLTFNFFGGKPSYTYTITGIDSTSYGPTTGTITDSGSVTINNLQIGTYLISGYDSLGTPVNTTVTISGPTPLYCVSEITKHPTVAGVNNGEITITSVGGGIEPYHYEVRDGSGALISGPSTLIAPQVISNLGVDVVVGYSVRVYDSTTPIASECTTTGLVMSGPTPLVATVQKTDVTCYGGYNGKLIITVTGGQSPYTIHTTGVNFSQNSGSMSNMVAGSYITNIVDSLSATLGPLTTVITQPVEMKIGLASAHDIAKQCDPTQYIIPFYYIQGATANQLAGVDPLLVQIEIDGGGWLDYATPIYLSNSSSTPQLLYVNVPVGLNTSVHLRLRNNDNNCFSSSINIFKAAMELPMIVLAVTPIDIQQQCVVGQAKLGVIINDLSRAPYSIDYTIDGVAGPTIQTFSNINNWTAPVTNTSANIVYTVTDVKGCIATTSNTVKTPSTQLTCNVTTTGTGPYIHIITGFGGIGAISGLQTITDNNLTITATITDSVGCTATKIG